MSLAKETLETVLDYLPRLQKAIIKEVEELRKINEIGAQSQLGSILEGIDWIISAIHLTQNIQVNVINLEEIVDIIESLVESIENKDIILIADILEYEVNILLSQWYEKVTETVENR